ncbi:response regulator transcription factor [Enterococcus ureasiticus]|uniref:winged helix-turn-helix domain-containing protein n=1 Tax=Enterococcus ureasiticus TaxID=903984 RepID=UPI001A8F3D50|nr:winged helix-turn-helix domain-containing protein [Enterococcus ureasiticus]MBO0473347.1 response regulator transcription factor [Enterococcus ureasiticus]
MMVGILNKNSSESFMDRQTSAYLPESKKVVKDIDALLIFKNQTFSIVEICEWVIKTKTYRSIPIWIATSEKKLEEKSIYLQLGVCGIFEESYTIEEIDLSIRNSLNTMKSNQQMRTKEELGFQLDPLKLCLSLENTSVSLTKLEFFLVSLLYENKEEVCTYEMLTESLLGEKFELFGEIGQSRVANIVCKIRAKIAQATDGKSELIKTIRSRGYMLTLSA